MNILNKGRCSRCLASEMKEKIIPSVQVKFKDTGEVSNLKYTRMWRFCRKYNKFCRYCSGKCKESPMGIRSFK